MFDFDKHFKRTSRMAFGIIITNLVLGLGLIGGVIYVAVHFLKKIW